jgi:hypothetical protein
LQVRVNVGTCELPAQVALALVIFCMPMSVREAHKARRHGRRPRPLEARRRRRPRRARRRLRARLCCCLGCLGSSRAHTQRVCARVPLFRALVPPRRCPHRYEPAVRLPRRHFRAIQQRHARALPREPSRASPPPRVATPLELQKVRSLACVAACARGRMLHTYPAAAAAARLPADACRDLGYHRRHPTHHRAARRSISGSPAALAAAGSEPHGSHAPRAPLAAIPVRLPF